MSLRTGHGAGAGQPRIEVLPPDELPEPVAASEAVSSGPLARRSDGTFADTAAARDAGKRGGMSKARKVRLVDALGLSKLAAESTFSPYRAAAEEFVKFHLAQLSAQAGGSVGAAPSSMIASAALQLAASRWAFDRGAESGDASLFKLGSSMANDSRQNLLAAYELSVREARARPHAAFDPLERQMRIIEAEERAAGGSTSEPNEDDGSEPST
jgi:hypothetical protein